MLKKAVVIFCSIFFFGCFVSSCIFVAVDSNYHVDKDGKMDASKKDRIDFISKLDALLTEYAAATDSKKDAIKSDINKLIASNLDKDIAYKKASIAKKQENIAKLQKEINDIETDRKKYISNKVDFLISEKRQAKIHKKKEHFAKKKAEKNSAKTVTESTK